FCAGSRVRRARHSFPTRRSSDLKESLGQTVREHGYRLTLSDDRTYTRYRVFRGHYDFATSSGFDISHIKTLPQGTSDHRPILVTDRKSTRLNSSHVKISYAVFCL